MKTADERSLFILKNITYQQPPLVLSGGMCSIMKTPKRQTPEKQCQNAAHVHMRGSHSWDRSSSPSKQPLFSPQKIQVRCWFM